MKEKDLSCFGLYSLLGNTLAVILFQIYFSPRLGPNTLTPAKTPRLGLCHNTLTPAKTPRARLTCCYAPHTVYDRVGGSKRSADVSLFNFGDREYTGTRTLIPRTPSPRTPLAPSPLHTPPSRPHPSPGVCDTLVAYMLLNRWALLVAVVESATVTCFRTRCHETTKLP